MLLKSVYPQLVYTITIKQMTLPQHVAKCIKGKKLMLGKQNNLCKVYADKMN